MSDINSVVVVGRVGQKPELKYLTTGTAVLDLSIANNAYQGQGKEDKVNWFNVTVFGKRAESCEKYLDKGSQVVVLGRMDHQTWMTKDNQKRSTIKIIANTVQFVGSKKNASQPEPEAQPASQPEQTSQPEEPQPEPESNPEDAQEELDLSNNKFESPLGDDDDIPF